ncbi:outer membrane protein assembly factor BamB family protein [Tellurirhabdus bombi]|uniref:outer membrane protein assembly factor BamB family protein n=1 Tax=Tellurirhabdus bombi TaxID=2907205 RepID=UPI001F25FEC1|nr:PQQ-binding-like beta-propeller repeat protein [Tellurirhabdus bombi]
MIRFGFSFLSLALFLLWQGFYQTALAQTSTEKPIRFAFVTDTHVGAPVTAAEDLQRTVNDINTLPNLDFVVLTGDVTDFGSEQEFRAAKAILDGLRVKWYIFPGNHDTKWSENGCNSFRKIFGAERFDFTVGKYRFIGCGSGPNMRMAPGLAAREDVLWVRSIAESMKGSDQPVIFMNHYPLDDALGNWYLLIDELKKINVQAAFCGHGHSNKKLNFEGIPAVMGRSNLRANQPGNGYNLVTLANDTLTFAERTQATDGQSMITKQPWHTILLQNHHFLADKKNYPRPSFQVNEQYPQVKVVWEKQDSSDVGAAIVADKQVAIYPNTQGYITALSPDNGQVLWRFATQGKVYSSPALHKNRVVVASTDGTIYCLDKRTGKSLWKQETGYPIVASPLIDGNTVYLGSSEGKFRALALRDGSVRWEFNDVNSFVESVPVADKGKVYFGSWGSSFYALDKKTGKLAWRWTNGKGRNYSPAACIPVLANGRVFLQTPDRTVTALDAETGQEIWKSNRHKGFESMGVSEDKSLIYVKCMQDSVWAISTKTGAGEGEWFVNCGYGYEISPGPITEAQGTLYIPTDDGFVYAVDAQKKQLIWAHKLSNAMINKIWALPNKQLLVTTMDGKLVRLQSQ